MINAPGMYDLSTFVYGADSYSFTTSYIYGNVSIVGSILTIAPCSCNTYQFTVIAMGYGLSSLNSVTITNPTV